MLEIKENGNELFRNGFYDEASLLYSEALKLCPFSLKEEKSMLYNNRAASRAKQVLVLHSMNFHVKMILITS